MGSGAIKCKTFGERTPQLAQASERPITAVIAAYLKFTDAGYPYFDLVAFSQFQSIDHGGW